MKIKPWLMLMRPFTLIAPFISIFFGVLLQLSIYKSLDIFWQNFDKIFFASLSLSFAQAVGQIMNQVEDVEIDRANKKGYRPIASGEISIEKAQLMALILSIFTVIIGFIINTYYGIFMLAFLFSGILYNLEPFRLKKRLWLNTASLAISRGLLPVPAAWCVVLPEHVFDKIPWLLGSVIAIWVLAWQNTKDFDDIEGDKKHGIITPAVYHGIKNLSFIILILSIFAFILLGLYIKLGLFPIEMSALFILFIPTAKMLHKLFKSDFSPVSLENNELWVSFYLTLAGFYIISAAAYLIKPYLSLFT